MQILKFLNKPNWTINICIELSKYFYNECEFVIEIYIGVNDSYEVFIYFRKNSKVLKFDEKLDKFMKDITANFYKNFEKSVRNPFLVKYRSEGRPQQGGIACRKERLRRKNPL